MITKEDFKKLSQLSRIEYLLRRNKIEENNEQNNFNSSIRFMWDIIIVSLLVFIFIFEVGGIEQLIKIFGAFRWVFEFTIIWIVICALLDLFLSFRGKKKIKELDEEFFKFKTEVKK
jgi:hypothetical protein